MHDPRRAHVVLAPMPGGVVDHVLDLVRFDPCGAPCVVLPPWPGLDRAAARCAALGAAVVRRAPAPRSGGVQDWLATRPVDLVHVHFATAGDGTATAEAALAAGLTVVTTDHACPDAVDSTEAVWEARRRIAPRVRSLADSRAIATGLAPRLGTRVHVVHHGIDVARYAALPGREVARRGLGIAAGCHVVASAGALFSTKGMHRVIEAVAGWPEVAVVVAGEGPERPRLAALARERGVDLRLPGWLDDVRPLFAAADVFVHASDSEGLPSVVLQARAAGLPVVATRAGGTPEAVGKQGVLVEVDDADGLRSAIEAALAAPAAARCAGCLEARFDARVMARRVSEVHAAAWAATPRTARLVRAAAPGPS